MANVLGCFGHESKLISHDRLLSLDAYNKMKQCVTIINKVVYPNVKGRREKALLAFHN